ncbi:MAG: hypothetical protein NZ954_08775, partial [Thermofilaceae archaeon]|nr:hypothetical protein [Thermofilaceae archaeon]
MNQLKRTWIKCLYLIAALALITVPLSISQPQAQLIDLNLNKIMEHVSRLSGFGSRMTGYPGYYQAVNYIYGYLKDELNLKVLNNTYKVLVPIDVETYIEVLEPFRERVKAYVLYPNGVNPSSTPPDGLEGSFFYAGSGDLASFNGKEVNGSIVALEFNSQANWLNAAKLGAKAVVFIEPDSTTFYECDKKFLDTPIYFPRVYVRKTDWERLRGATRVRVVSRVEWREIEAVNLVAIINGSSASDVIVLASHFDSWSVVPALASSKSEAIAPALLMELAR